jgi:hypothetical protein
LTTQQMLQRTVSSASLLFRSDHTHLKFLIAALLLLVVNSVNPLLAFEDDDSTSTTDLLHNLQWEYESDNGDSRRVTLPFVLTDGGFQEISFTSEFSIPVDSTAVYLLRLDGVNYACRITINDHFLHSHALGYAPFQLEIPGDILRPGTINKLQIEVHNHLDYKGTIPVLGGLQQPRNETGLPRSIELIRKSQVHISSVKLSQELISGDERTLRADILLRNAATAAGLALEEEFTLTVSVPGHRPVNQSILLHPQSTESSTLEIQLDDPPLWSCSEPRLLQVEVQLAQNGVQLDSEVIQYGIRDISVSADDILLNGERLQLRGLVYHMDGVRGQLLDDVQLATDVALIKNMGCNTVILRGAPASIELLNQCDRNGLFLIDNLPIEQPLTGLLNRESIRQAALAYLHALLERDQNHPSLLAVNLLTDAIMGTSATDSFLAELLASLTEQSPLTTAHFAAIQGRPEVLPSVILVDEQLLSEIPASLPGEGPVVVSGLGLLAESGNLSGFANPWSEIHQAQQIDLFLQRYNSENYAGMLLHSFTDWHSAHPLLWKTHHLDLSLYTDGLYTLDRQEKIAARVVHSHLTGTVLPPLTRGDFSQSAPMWPSLIPLLLLLLLVIAMKYNNILSLNLKRSLVHTEGFYRDIQSRRSQQLSQGAFVALLNSLMLASLVAVTFYYFRKTLFFDEILTLLLPNESAKTLFIYLSWHPLLMQIYTGLLFFVMQWFTGTMFFLIGVAFGSNTTLRQMLQYLFWSATPLLFLLPVALIFGQLLTFPGGTAIIVILLTLFTLWFILRLVRVSHFAYPANLGKVLAVIFILMLLTMLLLFLYYESGMAFTDRLFYLLKIY